MTRGTVRRVLMGLGLSAAAVALALVAGALLPDSVWPVVVGVLAGMAASLPTSLIIVWRVNKAQAGRAAAPAPAAERQPHVIVVPPVPPVATKRPTPSAPTTGAAPPYPTQGLVHESRPAAIIGGRDEVGA